MKLSFVGGGSSSDPLEAQVKALYESLEWNFLYRATGLSAYDKDWTGLGAGATEEEAKLHGINEWVERDGFALFLLKSFVKKTPHRPIFL
jgi:ribosomal protein S12 methylthiotransferase accessory factor YcaO